MYECIHACIYVLCMQIVDIYVCRQTSMYISRYECMYIYVLVHAYIYVIHVNIYVSRQMFMCVLQDEQHIKYRIYLKSLVIIYWESPSLLNLYDVMCNITNDIITHPKPIKGGALCSLTYNTARFQRVYINLLVDCALILS